MIMYTRQSVLFQHHTFLSTCFLARVTTCTATALPCIHIHELTMYTYPVLVSWYLYVTLSTSCMF